VAGSHSAQVVRHSAGGHWGRLSDPPVAMCLVSSTLDFSLLVVLSYTIVCSEAIQESVPNGTRAYRPGFLAWILMILKDNLSI
jgi:hypothetical protein